jgi:transaldolase
LAWGRRQSGDAARVAAATADRLAVSVGVELLRLVPGFVSTEVDANLSFNVAASVARAARSPTPTSSEASGPNACSSNAHRRGREYALHRGVKCNMTLLLNRAQAIASAEAGAFVISPFVGRIYDWHKKSGGKDFTADEDPGVRSVPDIYGYYSRTASGMPVGISDALRKLRDRPRPQRAKAAFHPVRRLKQVLVRHVDGNVALRRCERVQHELGLHSRTHAVLDQDRPRAGELS